MTRMARERIATPLYAGSTPVADSNFHKGYKKSHYDWFLFIMALFKTVMRVLYFYNNVQIDVDKAAGSVTLYP